MMNAIETLLASVPWLGVLAFLIDVALKILSGGAVPPAVYSEHTFISQDNIDEHCPEVGTTEGV